MHENNKSCREQTIALVGEKNLNWTIFGHTRLPPDSNGIFSICLSHCNISPSMNRSTVPKQDNKNNFQKKLTMHNRTGLKKTKNK